MNSNSINQNQGTTTQSCINRDLATEIHVSSDLKREREGGLQIPSHMKIYRRSGFTTSVSLSPFHAEQRKFTCCK
uniref:Uncharacterized protein n=1 Tax=Nelumbo nucifera TaxID=4432 RepID=A0A822XKF8_NELNU|nr:TPA_asm: hypothetical protein HUJ06_022240 [Nelumbo nucifera]